MKRKRKHTDLIDEDATKGGSESSASEIRSASEEPMDNSTASFTLNLWQQNRPLDKKMERDEDGKAEKVRLYSIECFRGVIGFLVVNLMKLFDLIPRKI